MSNRAWVTLATNDSYGLGALVLAHSLRRAGSTYPSVVLITPSVTDAMRERLRAVFAEVVIVDVLDSKDAAHLALLQRPELGISFTKIHCWNLTQYEKCVFLDADTLIVQNCDELFEREELSAAPDVGWPDCFNSGVFVFKPSAETFDSLVKFAQERGSFDGGDQGLLNSYFSDWAHGDINKHLPFLYNVTSAAFYSYIPALQHYGQNLKIIHFIGTAKPWLQQFNWETRTAEAPQHLREFLQLWWDIFVGHVHSQLDISMVEVEEGLPAVPPPEPFFDVEPSLDYPHYEPTLDPESEFPWHHPDAQIPDAEINVPEIDMTQFHDPWDIYRGHIPPNIDDSSSRYTETHNSEKHDETRKYAWDYMSPQQYHTEISSLEQQSVWQQDYSQPQFEHVDHSHSDFRGDVWDYKPQYNEDHQSSHDFFQHTSNYDSRQQDNTTQYIPDNYDKHDHHQYENHYNPDYQQEDHNHLEHFKQQREIDVNCNDSSPFEKHSTLHSYNDHNHEFSFQKDLEKTHFPVQNQHRIEHVYYVHLDHEREQNNNEKNKTELESKINGDGESDSEYFENIRPRHPYDGFYLRHRITIDSRGRKICTHEVPPTPTPSPPESPTPEATRDFLRSEAGEEITESNGTEDQTGVAGNLARVVLGASAQQEALDDLTRRQGWEAGNIDYMGADAFDNIWAKISQTLSQPRTSPPKQSTPPPATVPTPVEAAPPVEEKPAESPAPVEAPAPQATTVVDTPAPAIPLEASVPSEAPAEKPEAAKTETPVLAAKPPESSAPVEAPAAVPEPAKPAETGVEVSAPSPAPAVAEPPAAPEPAKTVAAVAPTEEPKVATPAANPASPAIPVEEPVAPVAAPAVPVEAPAAPVEAPVVPVEAPAAPVEAPVVPVEAPAAPVEAPVVPVEAPATPSEAAVKAQASEAAVVAPKAVSPPQSPAAAAPSKPKAPKPEVTPEKGASPTDSPPLANTPSKEEVPIVPAVKSEERRKPAEKLQLPAAAADALPTPDSELEDAAALAHAIIASELRTPTVTSPSPGADPASPASPASPLDQRRLSADEQAPPTPPVGVSLAQIGVKPKPTIAAQIESSVTEAADPAPKKKVVKKVLKKEAAPGEAPVPPPRKKEKKPKDK